MPGTPTYKSAKFLLKFLSPSTANEYTVNDSFHFAEEICQQDSNKHMTSLDVDSLFSNHIMKPLVCVDNEYNDNKNLPNIPNHDFCNLLNRDTE